ncbi:MAG: UbiA family prenyltransferase [Microthrixaceae bacterium]
MIRFGVRDEAPTDPSTTARFRLPGDPTLVRADDWWNDKIPHLIAIAAIGLTTRGWSAAEGVLALVLFLLSAIGVAAFGHVVNDLADIEADHAAGKPNRTGSLSRTARTLLPAGCLLIGLLPWIALPRSVVALSLLAAEVVLLVAYSVPPVRLKTRAAAGALADALYAYSLPMALAVVVFTTDERPVWVLAAVGVLGLLVGLRGIVWHQVLDQDNDRAGGVHTLVTRFGERRALTVVDLLAPVELAVLGALTIVASSVADAPVIAISSALYVPWRLFQLRYLWSSPLTRSGSGARGVRSKLLGYGLSMGLMERWLPVVALTVLSWREPWWWLVTIGYLLSFRSAVSELVADVPRLMDGVARLLAEPTVRRTARQVRAERTTAAAAARPQNRGGDPTAHGRWVFVLCGTAVHTGALRTAVRHLAPLTAREIWVLTDRSRNQEPVDETGVTRVVDVRAPAHLDDHQAAIWLKTSVHRHMPTGTWCYLDTDIIAIAPGVDELFEHRAGPVAFAADMPLAVNTVDHFSPFAMTCGCLERGLLRCDHLRRQLASRLEVEVPADWCHWNGGVFAFGPEGHELLERWHALATESFDWPEWRTRDQGALIATAWLLELQDLPRLPAEFNFIVADPWNNDVYLDRRRGWSLGPDGPWVAPRMLHLFQSGLDEPDWDLGRDVEVPILRRTLQIERVAEFADWRSQRYWDVRIRVGNASRSTYWAVRKAIESVGAQLRRTLRRLRPRRIIASVRRRTGRGTGPEDLTER